MAVRPAVFAGSWYPASAGECERQIERFLETDIGLELEKNPVGVIVPHAGWAYSGGIACRAISLLTRSPAPDTIVVFGMHMHPEAIETPFGNLEVDESLGRQLTGRFSFREEDDRQFSPDNTIELQLPFIRYFFPDVKIVPIGVPPSPVALKLGTAAVEAADEQGRRVAVVGSTDLTHYGANFSLTHYGTGAKAHQQVRENEDRRIIDLILAMDPMAVITEALDSQNACCPGAAAAAIAVGKLLGATNARLTEYASSYEMSPGDSFVGYAGIVF